MSMDANALGFYNSLEGREEETMATASFGQNVKLTDNMAQRIAESVEKPPKKVKVQKGSINSRIASSVIAKIK